MQSKIFYGYRVAFGSFIVMLTHLGFLGCIGVFMPHIAKTLNSPLSDVSLVVTTATGGAFVCSLFASKLITALTPKRTLYLSSVVCALHYVVFGFAPHVSWFWIGGVMAGFVMGFGTNVAVASIISAWFIEKRSTVIGLVFGGAGFGSAIAMFVAGQLIENFGWRTSYFILAAVILVLGIVPNLFLIRLPEQKKMKPLGWEKQEELEKTSSESTGLTLAEAKQTPTFKLWWVAILLISMLFTGFSSFAPSFFQASGMTHLQSTNITSITNLVGAVFIMLSGMIAERFGIRIYISYILISFMIGTSLMATFPNTSFLLTALTIAFIALSAPASNSFPPTITTVGFGTKDYTKIVAQFASANYLSKAVMPIIMGQIDRVTGSLRTGFIFQVFLAFIGLSLLLIGLKMAPKIITIETSDQKKKADEDVIENA